MNTAVQHAHGIDEATVIEMPTHQVSSTQAMQANEIMMSDEAMTRIMKVAALMASSKVTIPKHLQGSEGDCFAIAMQAAAWGMNPFAVAQKTHLVNGVLGYEAQLVNAVIIQRAPVTGRPDYEWYGDWTKVNGKEDKDPSRGMTVSFTIIGEDKPRVLDIGMHQVGTVRNSPMWVSDPRQQLAYLAVKRWSRLHTPDVILGVYTPDELAEAPERTVSPEPADVPKTASARLKERAATRKGAVVEGTSKAFDLKATILEISKLDSLESSKSFAESLPKDLDKASIDQINLAYKTRKAELSAPQFLPKESIDSIVSEMDKATAVDILDTIHETRFEKFVSNMRPEDIDRLNDAYERNNERLTGHSE